MKFPQNTASHSLRLSIPQQTVSSLCGLMCLQETLTRWQGISGSWRSQPAAKQGCAIWILTVQCTCQGHFGIWNLNIRPCLVISDNFGSAGSVMCHARSYTASRAGLDTAPAAKQLCPENTNTCVKAVKYSTSSMIPWLPELPAYRHWACLSFFALA